MTERERLIELINEGKDIYPTRPIINGLRQDLSEFLADHLLANGVIVPPCKVGDKVYSLPPCWRKDDGVSAYQITNFIISHNKKGIWTKKYRAMWFVNGNTVDAQINFWFDDIGKAVFFSREEAEKALKNKQ